jgi:hypothetical protein
MSVHPACSQCIDLALCGFPSLAKHFCNIMSLICKLTNHLIHRQYLKKIISKTGHSFDRFEEGQCEGFLKYFFTVSAYYSKGIMYKERGEKSYFLRSFFTVNMLLYFTCPSIF